MTPNELAQELRERAREIRAGFPRCVSSVHAMMSERIFERGERAGGGKIGEYNESREMWVNPDKLPQSTSPRGKPGRERNVQNRRTAYFRSYRDLRKEQGREDSFINFRLTGNLQRDFITGLQSDGEDWIVRLSEQRNIDVKDGLENRFGFDIFEISNEEEEQLIECIENDLEAT